MMMTGPPAMPPLGLPGHNGYLDLLRRQHRRERPVLGVAEDELERMPARRQIEGRFGLAAAEMKVALVGRYDLRLGHRLRDVDKQMVVPGVGRRAAGLRLLRG